MRLWHYKLIPFLPKSQLLAQWRELNSIFKKQDKHILINYIYEYPKDDLYRYTQLVIHEMNVRGYHISSFKNHDNYFKGVNPILALYSYDAHFTFRNHHNERYLKQCFYNLQEKYDRGQKDFSKEQYERLEKFVSKVAKINEKGELELL